MRFISYLSEEYVGTVNNWDKSTYPVFINPDKTEMRELDSVRFFVNFSKKKLLVWDADVIHLHALDSRDIQKSIGINNSKEWADDLPNIFSAYGFVRAGKIREVHSDGISVYRDFEAQYKKIKDDWTTTWFESPLTKIILNLIKKENQRLQYKLS